MQKLENNEAWSKFTGSNKKTACNWLPGSKNFNLYSKLKLLFKLKISWFKNGRKFRQKRPTGSIKHENKAGLSLQAAVYPTFF